MTVDTAVAEDLTFTANWQAATVTFTFSANGAKNSNINGSEYADKSVSGIASTDSYTLPECATFGFGYISDSEFVMFSRYDYSEVAIGTTYYTEDNAVYVFQGWSVDPNTQYVKDLNAGKTIHADGYEAVTLDYLYEYMAYTENKSELDALSVEERSNKLREYTEQLKSSGAVPGNSVTLYAIWDKCPVIDTVEYMTKLDRFIISGIQNGTLESFLLDNASADDREDGVLLKAPTDDETVSAIKVRYYYMLEDMILQAFPDADEFHQPIFKISVTYRAVDAAGNVSVKTTWLWINSTYPEPTTEEHPAKDGYVRKINEYFYSLGDVESPLYKADYSEDTYKNYGGCHPDSYWYCDPEYKAELTRGFRVLREDIYEEYEYVFFFTHEEVLEVQKFIDEYGMGTSKNADGFIKFGEQFAHCLKWDRDNQWTYGRESGAYQARSRDSG